MDARDLGDGFPEGNLIPRGLVVLLGDKTYACYDTDLLRVAAVWEGAFLAKEGITRKSYDKPKNKAGGGIGKLPKIPARSQTPTNQRSQTPTKIAGHPPRSQTPTNQDRRHPQSHGGHRVLEGSARRR